MSSLASPVGISKLPEIIRLEKDIFRPLVAMMRLVGKRPERSCAHQPSRSTPPFLPPRNPRHLPHQSLAPQTLTPLALRGRAHDGLPGHFGEISQPAA